jgi:hypothetical protein
MTWKLQVLFIIVLLLSACEKDKDEPANPPGIMIMSGSGYVSGDTSIMAGGEINFKVLLQVTDLSITNYIIDVTIDGASQRYFDTAMSLSSSYEWHGKFIKSLEPVEEWVFTVRDSEGNASDMSLTITLDTSGGYQTLLDKGSVFFGAQENALYGNCYFLPDGIKYYNTDVEADTSLQRGIDLIYYYDDVDGDKNTIASPGANIPDGIFTVNPSEWTIINTSRFFITPLTADDYNAAVNDSIVLANYNEAEAKRKAKKLGAGDIYTFRTQSGKLGIFMVKEVNGTTEGNVEISLKVQP